MHVSTAATSDILTINIRQLQAVSSTVNLTYSGVRPLLGLFSTLPQFSYLRIMQQMVLRFTLNNLAISVCFTFCSCS